MNCLATIRRSSGNAEVNVRSSPNVTPNNILFKAPTGTANLRVVQSQPDTLQSKDAGGKLYYWFQLEFTDKRIGWIRADLLDIQGDCADLGYGTLAEPSHAHALIWTPPPMPPAEQERVRKAAFNITSTFEGGGENAGYTMYQTYDAGIISYGRFQFTLVSGALSAVVDRYLNTATSETANQIRSYQARIKNRDKTLKTDKILETLLKKAGLEEQAMKDAQNWKAQQAYWVEAIKRIDTRELITPLAQALVFDMCIHHGFGNVDTRYLGWVAQQMALPKEWQAGQNNVTERQFILRLAQRRRDELYRQAGTKLAGLKLRGDFWIGLIEQGDWQLQGDAQGMVTPKSGRKVNVKQPV